MVSRLAEILFSLLSIVPSRPRRAVTEEVTGLHNNDPGAPDPLEGWATGRLLSTAARLLEHAWDAHLAQWDLNHASHAVLFMLEAGPRSQRELAATMQVQDQTMSRVVERMERSGYVTRVRSQRDRRRVLVSATDAGREAARLAVAGERAERLVTEALPEDDTAVLREHLLTLVRRLGAQRWA